jgi:SAM-dependent methyltransferase
MAENGHVSFEGGNRAARLMTDAITIRTAGIIMTRDPKHVVKQGYDRIAERHAQWAAGVRTEERERYLSAFCTSVPEGARVLELGCGASSRVTRQLASRFRLVAVDISARSVEKAQQEIPQAEFLIADMTEVDFPPATFAGVAAFYSIIHVPRKGHGSLLTRIGHWLRPGGVFVGSLGVSDAAEAYDEDWLGTRMF